MSLRFSNDKISSYMFLLVGFIYFDLISAFILSWGWQELLTPYYFVSRAKQAWGYHWQI